MPQGRIVFVKTLYNLQFMVYEFLYTNQLTCVAVVCFGWLLLCVCFADCLCELSSIVFKSHLKSIK